MVARIAILILLLIPIGVDAQETGFAQTLGGDIPEANIVRITNLDDSGEGSARWAIEVKDSPKKIVSDVSGIIALKSDIVFGGFTGNTAATTARGVTFAGGTSEFGLLFINYGFVIERNCEDIIIRNVAIMPGDTSLYKPGLVKADVADPIVIIGHNRTGPTVWNPAKRIRIENCSLAWGGDINIMTAGSQIDFVRCLIYECLHSQLHPKGPHSRGLLVSNDTTMSNGELVQSREVFINQCVFDSNQHRNPFFQGGLGMIANNIVNGSSIGIEVRDAGLYDAEGNPQIQVKTGPNVVSVVDNYLLSPTAIGRAYFAAGSDIRTRIHFPHTNYVSGWHDDPWPHISTRARFNMPTVPIPDHVKADSPPIWVDGYYPISKTQILENVGSRPDNRNASDQRIVDRIAAGQPGQLIQSQNDVGGWPVMTKSGPDD